MHLPGAFRWVAAMAVLKIWEIVSVLVHVSSKSTTSMASLGGEAVPG